jgi:serine/threonine-protein kinase
MDSISRLSSALTDRYTIERELGQGGMATVYLAHDVRHDRKVALKVLRPELSAILGADRFLQEIKTTANLQHPHILPLHDSGEADGMVFYVMPFIEGESLRDRLTHEQQLPVDDAVRITREVAEALDYAHRQGVIHRDIKPENILLHDGRALVADFGIALAVSRSEGGTRMTETGMSLGTPHYMSPEQAMGEREVTAKSDVYALGCVLYEMLTGEPPFTGPTAQAIIARVMTEEPRSLTLQRRTIPQHVEAAAVAALAKLPADRFQTAAQFAEALANPAFASTASTASTAATAATALSAATAPTASTALTASIALTAIFALLAAWGWLGRPDPPAQRVARHLVELADNVGVRRSGAESALAISPDGLRIAFVSDSGDGLLWVRRLDELRPQPLLGTDGARWPTFSPDGEWIAFVRRGGLEKVRTDGGATIKLADSVSSSFGGVAWLDDDTMIFSDEGLGLRRIDAAGGPVSEWLTPASGRGEAAPTPLPDARGVLFLSCSSNCVDMAVRVLDFESGEVHVVAEEAVRGWYLPTGHVVYVRRDGAALAAPFDLGSLSVTGPAVPVLEGVQITTRFPQLAVAENGTLLYGMGATGGIQQLSIVSVDRAGQVIDVDSTWSGSFNSFALAPDGRAVAVGVGLGGGRDIWIKRLDDGLFTRLTFSGVDRRPAWSPDGMSVAFVRDTLTGGDVYVRDADGLNPDRVLARTDRMVQAVEWSRDGQWLVLRTDNTDAGRGDILGVRLSGDTGATPLVASPYEELHPSLSPDGRWIAYTSNESGQQEVYVRPFPATDGGRWQVSIGGGSHPRWSPDGRELFYLSGGRLIAARVADGPAFAVAERAPLFAMNVALLIDGFHTTYEVTPDGQSFLFISTPFVRPDEAVTGRLVLVENWFVDVFDRMGQ